MLLLLTLALLGSTSSLPRKFYGSTCGTYFCTTLSSGDDLKGLRISRNAVGRLLNIQAKYGNCWGPVYGVRGGNILQFELWSDEFITSIQGSSLVNVRNVIVTTDEGRNYWFGKTVGEEFSDFPYKRGQVLKGICGFYDLAGIKNLGFEWGDPQVNSTNTQCYNQ